MATVTQLLDRAARITGLRLSSTERDLALEALRDSYRRAVMDAEAYPRAAAVTMPASSDTYLLQTLLGEPVTRLLHVSLGSVPMDIQQVSHQELMDHRATELMTGTPRLYSSVGFDRIAFYPNPNDGDQINFWYLPHVPDLVEGFTGAPNEETTPSMIPIEFHWAVLLPGLVLEMFDKDQRQAESQEWSSRYERGIARLQEHLGQMGGTANRAYVKRGLGSVWFRDQRYRP